MTDMQEDLMDLAKTFELEIGALYSFFSRKIPEDREFWEKMEWEEKIHANLIDKFAQEFKRKSSKMASDQSLIVRLTNSLNDVQAYIQKHRTGKISRKDAFEKAIQFEKMTLEVYFHEFFSKIQPPGSADILKMIQDQDKKHLENLEKMINVSK